MNTSFLNLATSLNLQAPNAYVALVCGMLFLICCALFWAIVGKRRGYNRIATVAITICLTMLATLTCFYAFGDMPGMLPIVVIAASLIIALLSPKINLTFSGRPPKSSVPYKSLLETDLPLEGDEGALRP